MTHIPYRCGGCKAVLQIHCPNARCGWLRCANVKCRWSVVDLSHGYWIDRDGKREAVL